MQYVHRHAGMSVLLRARHTGIQVRVHDYSEFACISCRVYKLLGWGASGPPCINYKLYGVG